MPVHLLRPGTGNPFLAHRLDGWEPIHPNVGFPVTFGVHSEGSNFGLYLAPAGLAALRDALALPPEDRALVLDSACGVGTLPWRMIDKLTGEVELVHLPQGADPQLVARELPCPLLAQPELAVPTGHGSRVAISLHDGCHGTVHTPDPCLLLGCLRGFIGDFQVAVLGRDAEVPDLDDTLLEPLVEPLPLDAWWGLRLDTGRRYWTLELALSDGEGITHTNRWVSEGEGGHWRAGWSW